MDFAILRSIGIYLGIAFLYLVGIQLSLPDLLVPDTTEQSSWWFLDLLDQFLAGGGLSRGGIFSLGLLGVMAYNKAPLFLGSQHTRSFVSRLSTLFLVAGVVTIAFVLRGRLAMDLVSLVRTFGLLAFGGIAVFHLNNWMVRYRGPDILHINVLLILIFYFWKTISALLAERHYQDLGLFVVGVSFIIVTTFWMLHWHIYIEVQNIKSEVDKRYTMLELRGVNENILDSLGFISMVLFILCGGVASLMLGWRTLSGENFIGITLVSVGVFGAIWGLVVLTERIWRSSALAKSMVSGALDTGDMLFLRDPARYVSQLISGYWIIPGVKVGKAMEMLIGEKLRRNLNRSLLVFVSWLVTLFVLQLISLLYGSGKLMFDQGPLVFLCLLIMVLTNLSMIIKRVSVKVNQLHMVRLGESRVVHDTNDTYSLRSPTDLEHLQLEEVDADYWAEERIAGQIRDMAELTSFIRHVVPRESSRSRNFKLSLPKRLLAITMRLLSGILCGLVIAFLGGAIYVLLKPSAEDLWEVVVPLFVTGLVTPDLLWQLIGHWPTAKSKD